MKVRAFCYGNCENHAFYVVFPIAGSCVFSRVFEGSADYSPPVHATLLVSQSALVLICFSLAPQCDLKLWRVEANLSVLSDLMQVLCVSKVSCRPAVQPWAHQFLSRMNWKVLGCFSSHQGPDKWKSTKSSCTLTDTLQRHCNRFANPAGPIKNSQSWLLDSGF